MNERFLLVYFGKAYFFHKYTNKKKVPIGTHYHTLEEMLEYDTTWISLLGEPKIVHGTTYEEIPNQIVPKHIFDNSCNASNFGMFRERLTKKEQKQAELVPNTLLYMNGKSFHCTAPECGCNVFHHKGSLRNVYVCNSCGTEYNTAPLKKEDSV